MSNAQNPFRVLSRHRNFRIFWIGQTMSLVGTWMQTMAQGWLALELSNSAFLVGLVASAGSLPIVLLSLPAGVFVDRRDKLRIVKIAQALLLLEAGALWLFTLSGHLTIGWLLFFAVTAGTISSVEIPARQSLFVELVGGREDLRDAIALNSGGFNLARIVGPTIAAIVIARLGIAWCFGLNALSYLAVLVGLFRIRLPEWISAPTVVRPIDGLMEGVRFMRDTPTVAALMKMVTVFSVLGVPFLTLMPVVARDRLGQGAAGYGVLLACVGIGGLAGALFLASLGDRIRSDTLALGSYAFAAFLLLFSLVRVAAFAYPLLLAIGFAMIVNSAVSNSLLQSITPDALRGRLMSAYSLVVVGLSQTVGAFIAGAVARLLGVQWSIGISAVIMLGYAYYALSIRPELRDVGAIMAEG